MSRQKLGITEDEWLTAKTVIDLDLYRSAKHQHRKWRLFGTACCRRAMNLFPDPRLDAVADAAEQFADSTLTWDDVKRVRQILTAVRKELGEKFGPDEARIDIVRALDDATQKKPLDALGACRHAEYAFAAAVRIHLSGDDRHTPETRARWQATLKAEDQEQVRLAHDIFGNPFRPVAVAPEWRTSDSVGLAQAIYAGRTFHDLPVLADALEEAGCDAAELLAHCRDTTLTHVRGCWAVDLVLGKA